MWEAGEIGRNYAVMLYIFSSKKTAKGRKLKRRLEPGIEGTREGSI